jgi:hypothetical protein
MSGGGGGGSGGGGGVRVPRRWMVSIDLKTKSIPAKSSQVNQNQIKPVPSQVKAHLVDDGELRVADEGDALEHRDRANNERRVGRDAEGELVRDLGEVRRELLPNPIAKYSRETNNNPLERRAGWMAGG